MSPHSRIREEILMAYDDDDEEELIKRKRRDFQKSKTRKGLLPKCSRHRVVLLVAIVIILTVMMLGIQSKFSMPFAAHLFHEKLSQDKLGLWYSLVQQAKCNSVDSTLRLGNQDCSKRMKFIIADQAHDNRATHGRDAAAVPHGVMIMLTSDIHGHVRRLCNQGKSSSSSSSSCYPGASSMASAVHTVRTALGKSSHTKVILIDAGDAMFGSSDANETMVADVMNRLGYNATVLGNHDFDVGPQRLNDFGSRLNFPMLASNVDQGPTFLKKHIPIDLGNGRVLCLVGVTTAEANPLVQFPILPETSVINYVTDLKRSEECHYAVVISHAGLAVDHVIAQSPVVDAIVGGHSHVMSGVPSDAAPESAEFGQVLPFQFPMRANDTARTPIAHSGSYGRYMGLLHLEWKGSKLTTVEGNLVPLDEKHGVVKDDAMEEWVAAYERPIEKSDSSEGNYNRVTIEMDPSLGVNDACGFICRKKECLLGNLVTDAMRSCVMNGSCARFVPDSAKELPVIALMESGTLRDCPANTNEDFSSILPWPNNLVLLTATGRTLHEMLDHGVRTRAQNGGGFLQTSGLTYQYHRDSVINATLDTSRLTSPPSTELPSTGDSLVYMSENPDRCSAQSSMPSSRPILNDTTYLLIVTDWLAAGGDGYGALVDATTKLVMTNVTLRETLLWHSSSTPRVQRDGRSCFVASSSSSSSASNGISGFVAGYVSFFAAYPLYTLFVRASAQGNGGEKKRSLFSGVWLGSLATAVCQFIYFLIYHSEYLQLHSPMIRSTLGAISTVLATNPLWVITTRMQTHRNLSLYRAIEMVLKDRGPRGFLDGVSMNLVMCIFPVVRQVVIEIVLAATAGFMAPSSSLHVALAAGVGACVATTVTLPIQRWRVRLQQGLTVRQAVTIGADSCDGLAFKVLHSTVSSIVLFVVKATLDHHFFIVVSSDYPDVTTSSMSRK